MRGTSNLSAMVWLLMGLSLPSAACAHVQQERGRAAVHSLAGCYLVDYSYVETEALQADYQRDPRVYDVNTGKSIKEWIYVTDLGPQRVWLQHILFAADPNGDAVPGTVIKHDAEDWRFGASFLHAFAGPGHWDAKHLSDSERWTRRITNLDDGLRWACDGIWSEHTAYPDFACDAYAPIPGRESRDMSRHDYNTMRRSSRVVAYGTSWLERQVNVKVQHSPEGVQHDLVRERGKNWYVRLPDQECAVAQEFVRQGQEFWELLRETWDAVLGSETPFLEKTAKGVPPRFVQMYDVEERYGSANLQDPKVRAEARAAILAVIDAYR